MSGTVTGGRKVAQINKARDPQHYVKIGRKGGSKGAADGTVKGFALSHARAVAAGTKGGRVGKRGPAGQYENSRPDARRAA